jgi:biopolymer transport protein ExbB/TolQ
MSRIQTPPSGSQPVPTFISWHQTDIEQRIGFDGGKFTRVNTPLPILLALFLTLILYLTLFLAFRETVVGRMMIDRGFTPYLMSFLFFWSLGIIIFKWSKLQLQRRVLEIAVIPPELDFVLSVSTVDQVLSRIMKSVDDARNFVLFNRLFTVLSNLRNLGRVADVDEMLRSQADLDESTLETSYTLLRGFVWAIPVLGFIGTVMGLSVAIGGFGDVLSKTSDPTALASSLKEVTGGLSTAFETTLLALLLALTLQLLMTFLHKAEEEFLDDCADYCQRNIVSKLRIFAPQPSEVH